VTILNNLQLNIDPMLIQRFKEVNQNLWQIEDNIRDQERQKTFTETFIELAQSVYRQNDQRAAIKKRTQHDLSLCLCGRKVIPAVLIHYLAKSANSACSPS